MNGLYDRNSPIYGTSNTKRMSNIVPINKDDLALLFPDKTPSENRDLFKDPDQIVPDDVLGKEESDIIGESLSYIPSIGNIGDTFGADKAGSNIGQDGRMEFEQEDILSTPPANLITHAQDIVSLISGPEEDQLDDGRVPPEENSVMKEMIETYFLEAAQALDEASANSDSSEYGIPKFKRYPLRSKNEVAKAIRNFHLTTNPKDRRALAKNIVAAYEKFNMRAKIPKSNPLYDYVPDHMRKVSINEDAIDEGVLDNVKMNAEWLSYTKTKNKKVAVLNHVTKTEMKEIEALIKKMRTVKEYREYKKLFHIFCKKFHIPERGTIVCDHMKAESHYGGYRLSVTYSNNTKKITLPEGTALYHVSTVAGIKELIPQHRGKSVTGYMYDMPRVYFSIHKYLPKVAMDLQGVKTSDLHKYRVTKDIREVYVDPLVWAPFQGAVYVETHTPIPVEEVTYYTAKPKDSDEDKKDEKESDKKDSK